MKKIRLLITSLFLAVTFVASAQVTRVTGTVTDSRTGESIVGATVTVKGDSSSEEAMTDVDGKFAIMVPSDAVLQVSFLGYKSASVSVNGGTTMNVALDPMNAGFQRYNKVAFSYSPLTLTYKFDGAKEKEKGYNAIDATYMYGLPLAKFPLYLEFGGGLQYTFYKDNYDEEDYNIVFKQKMLSVNIPVNLLYRFGFNGGKMHLAPYTGFYGRINVWGKWKYEGSSSEKSYDDDGSLFDDGWYKRFQLGWQIGAQFDVKNFYVHLAYRTDITNLLKDYDEKTRLGGFNIGIGVVLPTNGTSSEKSRSPRGGDVRHFNKFVFSYAPYALTYKYGDAKEKESGWNNFGFTYTHGFPLGRIPLYLEFGGGLQYTFWKKDESRVDMASVNVPLSILYRFAFSGGKLHLAPYTGFYGRINVVGLEKYEYGTRSTTDNLIGSVFKPFQLGWQIGAQFDVHKFYLQIAYLTDITNLAKDSDVKAHLGGVNFGIGVAF